MDDALEKLQTTRGIALDIHPPPLPPCSQNMDDALEKLQTMINDAVEVLMPKIADAATVERVKKK